MAADNWQHRSKGRICKTCINYSLKTSNIGRCKRNAPTRSGFPVVWETDWCGEHKLDETKCQTANEQTLPI